MRKNSGFTIVELLVVVIVIAILAAITIVAYNGIQKRTIIVGVQTDLRQTATKLDLIKAQGDNYPSDDSSLQISQLADFSYSYRSADDSYCLTATSKTLSSVVYHTSSTDGTLVEGPCVTNQGIVTTIAGGATSGMLNANGSSARFYYPVAIAQDSVKNLYVVEQYNAGGTCICVRKISPTYDVTTFAGGATNGSTNGLGTAALFSQPSGIAIDSNDVIYIADTNNHRIRKIIANRTVSTFVGSTFGSTNGSSANAKFNYPDDVAIDKNNILYVADRGNHLIRKIATDGSVTTLAGSGTAATTDGTGIGASFNTPRKLAVDKNGNVYVGEGNSSDFAIRKITPAGVVTTLFSQHAASIPPADSVQGMAVDSLGAIYITYLNGNAIYKMPKEGGTPVPFVGSTQGFADGDATTARFYRPAGITINSQDVIYVTDTRNYRIRMIQ